MPVRIGVVVFPGSNCDRDTVHALTSPVPSPSSCGTSRRPSTVPRRSSCPAALPTATTSAPGSSPGSARSCARSRPSPRTAASSSGSATASRSLPRPVSFRAPCCATPRCGSLARRCRSRRSGSIRRSPTRSMPAGRCACRSPTARAASTPTTRPSTRSSAMGRSSSATSTGGRAAGPDEPANPNGSLRAIAGVMNAAGNVAGLMPHPERASEAILGSDDGLRDRPLARRERRARGRRRASAVVGSRRP